MRKEKKKKNRNSNKIVSSLTCDICGTPVEYLSKDGSIVDTWFNIYLCKNHAHLCKTQRNIVVKEIFIEKHI